MSRDLGPLDKTGIWLKGEGQTMNLMVFYRKKCFGKNSCWNNVRRKCPMAIECKLKARALKAMEKEGSKEKEK
jgi:hypothetical protein